MNLVIVESPTKAKTIKTFLGKEYDVESSFGHIRDLPKSKLGIDIENNFKPQYLIPLKARKTIKELKSKAKKYKKIILATDEDREGEAIAWHLSEVLELKNSKSPITTERIVFHEITKEAVENALKNPRDIDKKIVDAQQARRILDRLVGYELSPFLWKKIKYGLSAGRVQSVAVKIIVDREREIQQFKPEEYHTISVIFEKIKKNSVKEDGVIEGMLYQKDGKKIEKFDIKTKEYAEQIINDISNSEYTIESIEKKEINKNPAPPFITSTLQQTASLKLGFSTKQTMVIAQQLYEGIEIGNKGPTGLITYMRTDSLNISENSLLDTQKYIESKLGKIYHQLRRFKTKSRSAQEAHEAIRPSNPNIEPEKIRAFLDARQFKLYDLIWKRFVASQMKTAVFDKTSVKIGVSGKSKSHYVFSAEGSILKFDGFLKIYPMKFEEEIMPELQKGELIKLIEIKDTRHFTEPPPRFNEASLIKALEKNGIGRPSTYAPTITTIIERNYVTKDPHKRLIPTETGIAVNDILAKHFPEIVNIKFTANMEEELDKIAEGKIKWAPVIKNFYGPFKNNLEKKYKEVEKVVEETDIKCPECGSKIIIKFGRYGRFYSCSNYPTCKYAKPIEEKDEVNSGVPEKKEFCEKCGKEMIYKKGRFGKFLACSGYPECKNIKSQKTTLNIDCPKCKIGKVVERRTKKYRTFYGCSKYPECDFAVWQKPTGETCPNCGSAFTIQKEDKIKCSNKECGYEKK